MTTTDEVLTAARELGKLVKEHEAARNFEQSISGLRGDTEAQRLLNDYNRQLNTIAEKESTGKPIEVDDKRKLEDLQGKLIQHPVLRSLQIVQMDYLDLMRRIDEEISGGPQNAEAPASVSALVNPDATGGGG